MEKSRPIKIMIVTDAWHPQVNGVVRTYEYLRDELAADGHRVEIIGPDFFPKSFPMPGYAEIRLVLAPYRRLVRAVDDFAPDLLHIATEGPLGLAARRYACLKNIRFTSCYHTQFPDYVAKRAASFLPMLYKPVRAAAIAFVRHFHKQSACVFVATPTLEKNLKDWGFKSPLKLMTRGIDTSRFKPGPKTVFGDLPRPVALYTGRVAIEKNLEAFLSMDWQGSKVVVGGGPDLQKLKKAYPDCIFTGPRTGDDLAGHYRSADIFVFPSRTDTFGMVLVEAMACGLPIAAYPVAGPVDIVTEDFLGALDEDLSHAARRALSASGTPDTRADHAARNYTWRKAANQFLERDE